MTPAGVLTLQSVWVLTPQYSDGDTTVKKHRPSDETLNRGPDSLSLKIPRCHFKKIRGVTSVGILAKCAQ